MADVDLVIAWRSYDDGWWLRVGRFTVGKDRPGETYVSLGEREGWTRVWRWRRYRATWDVRRGDR